MLIVVHCTVILFAADLSPLSFSLTLESFLPRVLVGFVSQHPLSLTALFGDSIAIPPNTEIKEYLKKAFNNQNTKNTKKKLSKKRRKFKKIRFLCHRDFAVVSHPRTYYIRRDLHL